MIIKFVTNGFYRRMTWMHITGHTLVDRMFQSNVSYITIFSDIHGEIQFFVKSEMKDTQTKENWTNVFW